MEIQEKKNHPYQRFDDLTQTGQLALILSELHANAAKKDVRLQQLVTIIDCAIIDEFDASIVQAIRTFASPQQFNQIEKSLPECLAMAACLDLCFDWLKQDNQLEPVVNQSFGRLKFGLFKIALLDSQWLACDSHPIRKLLSIIVADAITLTTDTAVIQAIIRTVEVISRKISQCRDAHSINLLFETVSGQYFSEKMSCLKKNMIFERRTCESELGKMKAWTAKFWANRQLNEYLEGHILPEFLHEMLYDIWQSVIVVDRLKYPQAVELQSLVTLRYLLASIRDIFNQDDVDKLIVLQKSVRERLTVGLETVVDSMLQRQNILDALAELHRDILKKAQSRPSQSRKSVKEEDQDIVRLQPSSQATFKVEQGIQKFSQRKKTLSPAQLDVWVDQLYQSHYLLHSTLNSEIGNNNRNAHAQNDAQQRVDQNIFPGVWYWLTLENKTLMVKLSTKLELNQEQSYVFVNAAGAKVRTVNLVQLNKLVEQHQIVAVEEQVRFDSYLTAAIHQWLEQESVKRAQLELARRASQKLEAQRRSEDRFAESLWRERYTELNAAEVAVLQLANGAWVEFIEQDSRKRCRVAAKLASSNEVVFVDRNGFKIKQESVKKLAEQVVLGELRLTLDNELFDITFR